MPLLAEGPHIYPQDLFETGKCEADDRAQWWVLHTKPRAEKAIARLLHGTCTRFFLPLHRRRWRNRGRMWTSYLPLFPSYVFLFGVESELWQIIGSHKVAQHLPVDDQRKLHKELAQLDALIRSGATLSPEEGIEPGQRVEIVSGPLTGMEGRVVKRHSRLPFVVDVEFLHRGASVEIDGWQLRTIGERELVQV